MYSLEDIKTLTAQRESWQLQFEETTGRLERGMKTLCAFLNGTGGTVLFGVTYKGKIIGQEVTDATKKDIAKAINRLEPIANVQVSYVSLPESDKKVVVLHVEESKLNRPFCYKGRAYMRMEYCLTSTMPQTIFNDLLMQRGEKYSWESIINPDLQITDIDEKAVMKAVQAGISSGRLPENTIYEEIPAILEKFDLLHNQKLNNAAAVLFARNLHDYPQCSLQLTRFKGTSLEDFIDDQCVQGNIYDLLNVAMSFFFKHLSLSGRIEGLCHEDKLSIPYKALRECCINAFCHRSYHNSVHPVRIAIYDNRIEVTNMAFPALLSTHDSHPQNPIIANALYKSKILESWGHGIRLMIDECRHVGIPEPEFHTEGCYVWVVFHYVQSAVEQVPAVTPQ